MGRGWPGCGAGRLGWADLVPCRHYGGATFEVSQGLTDSFERSLYEPVANRPEDVLEGVLIAFLKNLKPGLRNLECVPFSLSLAVQS